ncbi:MAG: hypothetical protein MJY95_00905 [Bacteroidaceae bacterium]|nr:hypothetical protein [Bacteroidaceae bacterium]
MKRLLFGFALLGTAAWAQPVDVTSQYVENPDFAARFAAWVNPGKFTYNIANTFEGKSGQVWMEKWVSRGNTLGTNTGIYQTLRNLPNGTYTLVAAAKNVDQTKTAQICTGAYLYAGQEQTAINVPGDYYVTFTVVNGKADVGVRLKSCNGNWVCIDNFRLYYCGENTDSMAAEQKRVDEQLKAMADKIEKASPTSLKVSTYEFVPTGKTIALGRSTVSGTCKEKGFCWSTHSEPTIFDEHTTETLDGTSIYVMRGLSPATPYYVRAYAMTSGGYVAYGEVHKIVTLPSGNIIYSYDNAALNDTKYTEQQALDVNARINSASAECIWMYNQLTYIPGFSLSVHYNRGAGAGDGTADCSYGGWLRVSQNVPYQQTGTILHETNHAVGIGTTWEWTNNSNLRSETSRGKWLGPIATKMVRFINNNTTSLMDGDKSHMWPYGINGANEDSYQPSNIPLYFYNIFLTHALHQDGIPCSGSVGFASPAYLFEQCDTTKYYLRNNAFATGYMYGTKLSVKFKDVSIEELKADDSFAWYVRYEPRKRYYYFINVATGKALTYDSGFRVTTCTTPTSAELFHLLPARVESELGNDNVSIRSTAYWILHPNKYSSPALTATAKSVVESKVDLGNEAISQQWFLLTADELDALSTGIEPVPADKESTATRTVYDLSGRRVYDTSRFGIYIVNGKKVLGPIHNL